VTPIDSGHPNAEQLQQQQKVQQAGVKGGVKQEAVYVGENAFSEFDTSALKSLTRFATPLNLQVSLCRRY
jgi:hypothetical protein